MAPFCFPLCKIVNPALTLFLFLYFFLFFFYKKKKKKQISKNEYKQTLHSWLCFDQFISGYRYRLQSSLATTTECHYLWHPPLAIAISRTRKKKKKKKGNTLLYKLKLPKSFTLSLWGC
jgi:hypothetical protein